MLPRKSLHGIHERRECCREGTVLILTAADRGGGGRGGGGMIACSGEEAADVRDASSDDAMMSNLKLFSESLPSQVVVW